METSLPALRALLPADQPRRYEPVGCCIFCGVATELTDEHIIPLGFGGRRVLPKASCRSCAKVTSAYELKCLRTMFGPLRMLYGMPTRRKKRRPSTLPLKVKKRADSDWEYVPVRQDRFPFLVLFPYYEGPGLLTNSCSALAAKSSRLWIRGASPSHSFDALCKSLVASLDVYSIMPEAKAEVDAFCRMLCKVAYAFACAELGTPSTSAPVRVLATSGNLDQALLYIGNIEPDPPPTAKLHELSIVQASDYTAVRIRLLARLGTPVYLVLVGGGALAQARNSSKPMSPCGADQGGVNFPLQNTFDGHGQLPKS